MLGIQPRKCEGCDGDCCNRFMVEQPYNPDWKRFYEYHGVTVKDIGEVMELYFTMPCMHQKDGRCRIYADRPAICRSFICDMEGTNETEAQEEVLG